MNAEQMKTQLLEELDDELRTPVERILNEPPPEAEMEATLLTVSQLIEEPGSEPAVRPAKQRGWSRQRWGWLSGLTLAVMAVATGFLLSSDSSFAQDVGESLIKRDWVHIVYNQGGQQSETWFSLRNDVAARRDDQSIEFRSYRDAEFEFYSTEEQTLYRVSDRELPRRYDLFADLAFGLPLLLEENTLSRYGLDDLQIVRTLGKRVSVDRCRDGGRTGDFRQLIIDLSLDGQPGSVAISVDESNLPQQCELRVADVNGREALHTFLFDYPNDGPSEIFALGVPSDVKVVDRVQRESETFLLAAVKKGSLNFDDYRGIAVTYEPDDSLWWINARKELVYRKGTRWRRNGVAINFSHAEDSTPEQAMEQMKNSGPSEEELQTEWWAKQLRTSAEPEGELIELVSGLKDAQHRWSLLPEFHARPPLGKSSINFETDIKSNQEGGLILLKLSRTGVHRTTAEEKAIIPETPHTHKYWIDPSKDHLVTRLEMRRGDKLLGKTVVEATAQTPDGRWYPTKLTISTRMPDDSISTETTEYFLTFPDEVDEGLFETR